jgi:glycosyltransferase involved in cell wall biosynthesis
MADLLPTFQRPERPAGGLSGSAFLSVIVPVYNCAAYLEQCLDSLLAQNVAGFEVLLVDDGSTDASGAICDAYAQRDARVRVTHKPNGGVSSARNLGMELARGAYVLFVDADDYVETHFVREMGAQIERHDVVVCAYDRVKVEGAQPFVLGPSGALSMADLYEHTLSTLLVGGGCCNKAFRLAPIRQYGLHFDTRIAVGEDMLFLIQYYRHCQSAYFVSGVLYHYRFNEVSSNEAGFSQKAITPATASILLAMDEMEQHIDRSVRHQAEALDYRKARSSLRLFFQMVLTRKLNRTLLADIRRNIRQSLFTFLKSRHSKTLERVVAAAIAVSATPTYVLARAAAPLLKERLGAYRT